MVINPPEDVLFFCFLILRRMGKNKAQAPTLPRIRYMSCFDLTNAPAATAARAAATGLVSMSTRFGGVFGGFDNILSTSFHRCDTSLSVYALPWSVKSAWKIVRVGGSSRVLYRSRYKGAYARRADAHLGSAHARNSRGCEQNEAVNATTPKGKFFEKKNMLDWRERKRWNQIQ